MREAGEEVIVTSVAERGEAREVARHATGRPGTPVLHDAHYPPRTDEAADRQPKATTPEEAAFLMLGAGAKAWLVEAAAAGARRIRAKMAEAVAFAKLYGTDPVDRALGTAATTGRFADRDLVSILGYQAGLAHVEPSRALRGPFPPTGHGWLGPPRQLRARRRRHDGRGGGPVTITTMQTVVARATATRWPRPWS